MSPKRLLAYMPLWIPLAKALAALGEVCKGQSIIRSTVLK
jgi:hypothetical protein